MEEIILCHQLLCKRKTDWEMQRNLREPYGYARCDASWHQFVREQKWMVKSFHIHTNKRI